MCLFGHLKIILIEEACLLLFETDPLLKAEHFLLLLSELLHRLQVLESFQLLQGAVHLLMVQRVFVQLLIETLLFQ